MKTCVPKFSGIWGKNVKMSDLFAVLEYNSVEFDGFVVRRSVGGEADVGDWRTLLSQLDAEDVNVLDVGTEKLRQFVAQLVDLTPHNVLRAVVPDADEVLVSDSGDADRTGVQDGLVRYFTHGDGHVGRNVRLRVLPVVDAESKVIPKQQPEFFI